MPTPTPRPVLTGEGAVRAAYATNYSRRPDAMATDKAVNFLRNLGHEYDIGMTIEDFDVMLGIWKEASLLTSAFVSERIEEYKACPKRPETSVAEGYYTTDGLYYKVVLNKAKTGSYAKQLILVEGKAKWEYAKGAVNSLRGLTPLSVEEAAAWGHLHGQCIICCRPLTDPESVMAGIGPVCAKKLKR